MGKLHELLAVESDLAGKAKSTLAKVSDKFGSVDNYLGQQRRYEPLIDGGQSLPNEDKQLPGMVSEDLDIVYRAFGDWLNASIQKEVTNQLTIADVEIDGETLLKELPATALLNLESKLAELGKLLKAIPVNDTATRWSFDDQSEAFVSDPRVTYRTEKAVKTHIAYEATKEHPAQVQTYNSDERIGEWHTIIHSGLFSPLYKRQIIERWEVLFRAIKQARQRANDIDTDNRMIADTIINYLRG